MKIHVIVGSTRDGRSTPRVAAWVEKTAKRVLSNTEVELVDLASFDLPMFSEAVSPKYNPARTPEPTAKAWLDKLASADGYVFVTPEYNHSVPGSFKNALDFIDFQMNKKVALIVSHGTVGGARATEHLRNIASELGLVTTPAAVNLIGMIGMGAILNDDNDLIDPTSGTQGFLEKALGDLDWYATALKNAR
jgi:NAD(P)H-dependent FMN reductase